ncbi:embryonic stem cell-specific 5-hydroxymethylcytosine-binding protein isoform X2 [Tasmannia lanceolata]|uniref:embryonic stem cell-specific 5-hydroxymethylcytosine-binding protein isoform X2 n=1 Tax=Tasmannia lanceolata TaxID=3420 RepID=UPI004063BFFA
MMSLYPLFKWNGSYLPVVRKAEGSSPEGGAVLHCMKWGLIPSFTKKTEKLDHFRMFNARSELIREKPSFRRLLPNNRCLVVVEGFYEWKKVGSRKQPYYIHFKDQQPLVFAALYDSWRNSEGEIVHTFTILTTCCSSLLQWLHDRMPVILKNKECIDEWLNGSPSTKFEKFLEPFEDPSLVWYPVTPEMGKPSFNGPQCIKEIKTAEKNSIQNFFSKNRTENKHESEPDVKDSPKVSVLTIASESLKEELITEENEELTVSKGAKSEVYPLRNKGDEKCSTKRDFEQFATDLKPPINNSEKVHIDSSKKKRNVGDGQSTLLSYFGRK